MKYKCVRISSKNNPKNWHVEFFNDTLDRKKEKRLPNALGFYWYPTYMDDGIAFNKLKQCMILRHKKEIQLLEKSLKKLKKLKK
jgi:hypothetical protein